MRVLDYGDQALLLEVEGTDQVLAWSGHLRDADLPGVLDIVPASRTVLVTLSDPSQQAGTRQRIERLTTASGPDAGTEPPEQADVTIDVVYDGEDLAEVARLADLDEDGVVAAHTGTSYRVGFGGFAPGFAYLIGGDARLHVPRRAEPRASVPAGSVGLAGEFSGVYPRKSPGGWQLIGRTDAALWDIDRSPPALLTPGQWVRFRALA
ncbi:MAG: 5-oxoprolinase subunit B family protein [Mycobacterium sp.]